MLTVYQMKKHLSKKIKMLSDSGHAVQGLEEKLQALPHSYDAIVDFARTVSKIPLCEDFHYDEPNAYEEIVSRQSGDRLDRLTPNINEFEIKDKIFGGIYGRMAGCILGKPMEMDMTPAQHMEYIKGCGSYPLNDYIPAYSPTQSLPLRKDCIESTREHLSYVQEDDDINYTILALHYLEKYGPEFRTEDVAREWLKNLPLEATFGPERFRYYTLAALSLEEFHYPEAKDELFEFINLFTHGCDIHIGAMIRGDVFGLVNPGRLDIAAKMAYTDATLTHVKNGIYQEMWVAAAIASAFFERDAAKIINHANSFVPQNSRYAEILREAVEIAGNDTDYEKCALEIERKYAHYGIGSGVTETCAIINSLMHIPYNYGIPDYEKAICNTVAQGWDTDCSGATAGCIAGVMAGYRNIPRKWISPLNDTVYSWVATEREQRISSIAERVYQASITVRKSIK